MSSRRSTLILALVVFFAGLGLFSRNNTFPFYYHPDEPGKVAQLINRKRNFHHPMLMLTTCDLVRRVVLHGDAAKDPQAVVELGRWVTAAFAAATAALLALLAMHAHGLWVGAGVGALCVLNPLLFELAHYFKEDPFFGAGVAATALAVHFYSREQSRRTMACMGAAAGLAAAGKYVGAAFVPAVMVVAACIGGPGRWKRAGWVFGSALLAWLVVDWWVFKSPELMTQSLDEEMAKAYEGEQGIMRQVPHNYYLVVQNRWGGPWVPALAVLWVAFAVWRPRRIPAAEWLLAGAALVLYAVLSFTPKTSPRYFLPIATTLCYLAPAGLAHWLSLAGKQRSFAFVAILLVATAGALQSRILWQTYAAFRDDDRLELIAAVKALPPSAKLAQDDATNLPEPDRRWEHKGREPLPQFILGAKRACDLGSIAKLRANGFTHVALCNRTFERFLGGGRVVTDPTGAGARRDFYETALKEGLILQTWKQGLVTYMQPGLVLIDITKIETPAEGGK